MSAASDTYRKASHDAQAMRQEYFNFQLPRILRALKECADEIDMGTVYHLNRYAFLYESVVLADGVALVPEEGASIIIPTY
jgi:Rho GTPase-activating protein RGD1